MVLVDNIIGLVEGSGLRKVGGALRLVYQFAIGLLEVVLVLLHHPRDPLHLLLMLRSQLALLNGWVESVNPHALLRLSGSGSIRRLNDLGWRRLVTHLVLWVYLLVLGCSIFRDCLHLSCSSDWLLHLAVVGSECTGSASQLAHVFVLIIAENWDLLSLLVHERHPIHCVSSHSSLLINRCIACGWLNLVCIIHWLLFGRCSFLNYTHSTVRSLGSHGRLDLGLHSLPHSTSGSCAWPTSSVGTELAIYV